MGKKVLIFSSTPRKEGNSDLLCDQFMLGAKEAGHYVEKIFLKDKTINYCTGCGYCMKNNHAGCAQKDDMEEIYKKILDADVIVMATPVYFYTMCGQMKTFIDRNCAIYDKISSKEFYFIATMGDVNKDLMETVFNEFRAYTYCLPDSKNKGFIYAMGVMEKGDVKNTPYMKEAYEMGKGV